MNEFTALGLGSDLDQAFHSLGFSQPTQVQTLAIPRLLFRKDCFMQSETGTGKTYAYLAPILETIRNGNPAAGPLALVLCPTQELAVQLEKHARQLIAAANMNTIVYTLLGGSPISRQESALKHKPQIVIGTPGRSADLLRLRILRPGNLEFLVLDEADRLFSREYEEPTETLLEAAPGKATRVLVSATIPDKIRKLAADFLRDPESIDLASDEVLSGNIEHWVFYVEYRKRIDFIRKFEAAVHPSKCLVFASSVDRVSRTAERLREYGLPADSIVSRQEKEHRRVALERFAGGELRYLVTTDLGARGLDIPDISHVLSLDFPEEGTGYIHRAGRTARAGNKGTSVVLADAWELKRISKLAVERHFVFRTKMLASGQVLEPPVGEFFAEVERGEKEKQAYRQKKHLHS
ncbi:MAG: DEAD/DEAH box helicase [Spirochaetaceae bacterium]|nr:DEAD/DEAH box helicase [Spirochaetaceae bacterium]